MHTQTRVGMQHKVLSIRNKAHTSYMNGLSIECVVSVAQLVRASGCGPEGREFEPPHSPSSIPQIVRP